MEAANEEDCERADTLWSMNPPLDDWVGRMVEAHHSLDLPALAAFQPEAASTFFQLEAGLTRPGGLRCTRVIGEVEKNPNLLPNMAGAAAGRAQRGGGRQAPPGHEPGGAPRAAR